MELRDIGCFMGIYTGCRVAHALMAVFGIAGLPGSDAHLSALIFAALATILVAVRERRA